MSNGSTIIINGTGDYLKRGESRLATAQGEFVK